MKKSASLLASSIILSLLVIVLSSIIVPQSAYANGTILGTLFVDNNSNGIQDSGESAFLGGTTVDLVYGGSVIQTTTSSTTDGTYSFTGLTQAASSYVVLTIAPNGYFPTSANPLTGSFTQSLNFGLLTPQSKITEPTGALFLGGVQVGNYVWVADHYNNQIDVYNTDGTSTTTTYAGSGLNAPSTMTMVGSSQVWVVNSLPGNGQSATISRFNTNGTSAGSALSLPTNEIPIGIAVVPQSGGGNQVWVTVTYGGAGSVDGIVRFNTNGTSAGSIITYSGMTLPEGIMTVTYASNLVWVTDAQANKIFVFNLDGTFNSSMSGNNMSNPSSLCYSPSGTQVWVFNAEAATSNSGSLSIFNVDQSPDQVLTGVGLHHPWSCASVSNSSGGHFVWGFNNPNNGSNPDVARL